MPVVGTEQRTCAFCGKQTRHTVTKTVTYHQLPHDSTKGTYIFNRTYTCNVCKVTTKA